MLLRMEKDFVDGYVITCFGIIHLLLYILEEDRNKGVGKQLVVYWENQMKRLGYHVVMTSTQENEEAKKFYDRLQYKKVGGFYPLDEGFELIMIKKIS